MKKGLRLHRQRRRRESGGAVGPKTVPDEKGIATSSIMAPSKNFTIYGPKTVPDEKGIATSLLFFSFLTEFLFVRKLSLMKKGLRRNAPALNLITALSAGPKTVPDEKGIATA